MVNTFSLSALVASGRVSPRRDWLALALALGLGLCAFGFIFHTEIVTAIFVWSNSYAYNHCFLILPIALCLACDRRQAVAATVPRPAPGIALLAIPAAAAWFVADRLGIMEGQQLAAMTLFQVMAASLLGRDTWRALAAPLLYLFFLVPFGEFVIPPLQSLVVHFTGTSLDLLGIPNFVNGTVIEIPEGAFKVEQACAGLRFLTAMAAFGVAYVCLMYTTPFRRALFVAIFLAAAIIGNCLRVLGTILIAHFTGDVKLIEADHVYWGWAFYVFVGLVVILIGASFRQHRHAPIGMTPIVPPRATGASVRALMLVILLAAAPRVAAGYLNWPGASATGVARIEMPVLPGCNAASPSVAAAASLAADGFDQEGSGSAAYRCGSDLFLLSLYRYPPRVGMRPLLRSLQAAETPFSSDEIRSQPRAFRASEGPLWRVTDAAAPDGRYVTVATALWLNGRPGGAGIASRIDQALNTLRRAPVSPILAVVTHVAEGAPDDRRGIDGILAKAGPISEFVSKRLGKSKTR